MQIITIVFDDDAVDDVCLIRSVMNSMAESGEIAEPFEYKTHEFPGENDPNWVIYWP